ncbi:MAG: RNA polymerase sigma factor [Nannocystaceae bacterium]|nr:RNA polymerase sigma factor [bacterium]
MTAARAHEAPSKAPPVELRALFDAHYDFVFRSALRLGVATAAVDDVVQETFIVAGRRLGTFEGRSGVRTWLFGILMRVAHTERRGELRRQRRAAVAIESASQTDDPYARRDAADLLHRLLATLDEDRRAAFILADVEGLTAVEIAEGLGVNVNTIYARVRSARMQLAEAHRQLLEEGAG